MKKWQTLSSKIAFHNPWFSIRQDTVQLPNGKILDDFFVWEGYDVAMVVPVTPEQKLVLVRQYKHAGGEIMIEYPAGFFERPETAMAAAQRELREETGYTSSRVTALARLINDPTKASSRLHVFLAQDVVLTHGQGLDENEEIEVLLKSIPEVLAMVERGEIWSTGTVAATLLAMRKLGIAG